MKLTFKKDYSVYKKGEDAVIDNSMLAANLIRKGVAEVYKEKKPKAKKK
ncbi:hypothetical protein [Nonlabens sp. YIK11]|nr:hypothetical protein [Nonlabens sp. YIK11]